MSELNHELFNLAMSAEAQPLMDAVKRHVAENVEPIREEFDVLHKQRPGHWEWHPLQLELLDGAKQKAKASGLWNFFLPDTDYGSGLTNLDFAYIAGELGRSDVGSHLNASETLNCMAPDTGNMEVLERVGTPEQKKQWLEPLLNGEIRSAYAMTEPGLPSSDAQHQHERRARRRRMVDQWREVLDKRLGRSTLQDHDRHGQDQSRRGGA